MTTEHHDLALTSDFLIGGYTANCSCGWESKQQATMTKARNEWENHCDQVFMEATGG